MTKYTTLVDAADGRSYRVPVDRLDPDHRVTLKEGSWSMVHPLTCDLGRCKFQERAENWRVPPDAPGVVRWGPGFDDWELTPRGSTGSVRG